jgi:hypothetical protein
MTRDDDQLPLTPEQKLADQAMAHYTAQGIPVEEVNGAGVLAYARDRGVPDGDLQSEEEWDLAVLSWWARQATPALAGKTQRLVWVARWFERHGMGKMTGTVEQLARLTMRCDRERRAALAAQHEVGRLMDRVDTLERQVAAAQPQVEGSPRMRERTELWDGEIRVRQTVLRPPVKARPRRHTEAGTA